MFHVLTIKAFSEPWWLDWEQDSIEVLHRSSWTDLTAAESAYQQEKAKYNDKFSYKKEKSPHMWAAWTPGDYAYCAACGDDEQVYIGVMIDQASHQIKDNKNEREDICGQNEKKTDE